MKQRDVLLAALALMIVWQVAAMIVNLPILPPPLVVLSVFFRELRKDMLIHFAVSLGGSLRGWRCQYWWRLLRVYIR